MSSELIKALLSKGITNKNKRKNAVTDKCDINIIQLNNQNVSKLSILDFQSEGFPHK
jgi:hypothetical protein